MGLMEDMQKLQESFELTKKLLDTGDSAYSELRESNAAFQTLLNVMFENNQKLIATFEGIENKLTAEESAQIVVIATHVTKANEGLLQILKVNKAVENSLGDSLTSISQEILAFTKR